MNRRVKVYRSQRKPDMYLYVDFTAALSRVPQSLLDKFGRPVEALSLDLTSERKLARADAETVLDQIESTGYYLQMPPVDEKVGG